VTESILSHAFPNGLMLLGEPMRSVQSAAFTLLVPAGCAHDPPDRGGLSSFTCDMAMRGAGERGSRQFILDLDNLGVEHHESVSNSHTSFGGATVAENLFATLTLYADMLRCPHLPEDQLESSRQVALQELCAVEDEPAQKTMLELRRRHYPDPWGQPAQGNREGLETTTIDDIRSHFARRYRPDGAILGVAGSFDWEPLKELAGKLLGDWEPCPAEPISERVPGARYTHFAYDSNQTQIGIAYPSVPYRDGDYYQARGALGVLSGGASARLFTEVRERRGLCYAVYATYHTLRDRGAVFCYAGTSADRAQQTLGVTLGELTRIARGVEDHELKRLKACIKSALIMQQESSSARSSSIARDWYHLGRVQTLDEVGAKIDALTHHSINAYLAGHPPADFTIVTVGPQELEVPDGVL